MAEAKRRWSWRSWLPGVGAAFSRFPLAVLLAAFLTLFKVWADNPSEAEFKILSTLAASFHLGRSERNASFWLFNHRLWLAALLALIGACLFGDGLSIILETLNFLFGLELPSKSHDYIWTIARGFRAPVSWLALAPQSFTNKVSAQQTEFTTRAVATIAKFVNPFAEGKTPEQTSREILAARSGPTFRNRPASSISPTTPTCLGLYRSAAAER